MPLLRLPTRPCAAVAEPAVAVSATQAPTRTVRVRDDLIAYRALGPERGVPLLLLNRFRGTMDHWDPALLAVLAAERRVLLFDQPGFARSEGAPPTSVAAFAANAAAFARALGIAELDLLGFSMGGTVAL
jgi:pimeloyl-ACP methyl ester carboxylesterase